MPRLDRRDRTARPHSQQERRGNVRTAPTEQLDLDRTEPKQVSLLENRLSWHCSKQPALTLNKKDEEMLGPLQLSSWIWTAQNQSR